MAENRANIRTTISADATQFNSVIGRAVLKGQQAGAGISKGLGRATMAMGGMAKTAIVAGAALAGAAAAAGLFKGSKLAASLESTSIAFETLIGNASVAKGLLYDLRKMGAETPFKFSDLADAAKTLKAFGVETDQILPTVKMLGDISSGSAEKMASLSVVMGQVASAGRLNGGDLLQFINASFNPLNVIIEKTGETMLEARKRMSAGGISFEEVADAMKTATSEGGDFYKMMEKQSKSFSGRLSTMGDAIDNALISFAAPINDSLGPYVARITKDLEKIAPIFAGAGREIADNMPEILKGIGKFINGIMITYQVIARLGEFIGITIGAIASPEYWSAIGNLIGGSLLAALDTFNRAFMAVFEGMKSTFVLLGAILTDSLVAALLQFTGLLSKLPGAELLMGDLPETLAGLSKGLKETIAKSNPAEAMKKEFEKDTGIGKMAGEMLGKGIEGAKPFNDAFENLLRDFKTLDLNQLDLEGGSETDEERKERWGKGDDFGYKGLTSLYNMQREKESGINVGARGAFANDRSRLGVGATGLSEGEVGSGSAFNQDRKRLASISVTGGLGEKRRLATSKDDKSAKKRETLAEKSNGFLKTISENISDAVTVK